MAYLNDARAIPYIVDIMTRDDEVRVACLVGLGKLKAHDQLERLDTHFRRCAAIVASPVDMGGNNTHPLVVRRCLDAGCPHAERGGGAIDFATGGRGRAVI